MKQLLLATVCTVLVATALPATALAWDPMSTCNGNPTAWGSGNPNTVWRLSSTYTSSDLSNTQVDVAVNGAFDEWSVPGCSEFDATQSSDTAGDPMDGNNSNNLIGFFENSWPAGQGGSSTLAVTMPAWQTQPPTCEIGEADMYVNAFHHTWVSANPQYPNKDLQSVLAHEAGHWLGLDHSQYPGSTLLPFYSNDTAERTLTCDDSEGVCALYPTSTNSCTADRYCDCGVGCNGGFCGGAPTGDDDDDAVSDDDDAGDGTGPCDGSSQTLYESEDNDWNPNVSSSVPDYFETSGGDTSVVGTVTCGNNGSGYTGDEDWFQLDFRCSGTAKFVLDWTNNADLDFWVYGSASSPLAVSNDAGSSGPVSVTGFAGGLVTVAVLCWEGQSTTYEFLVDWEPFQGSTIGDDDDDDTGSSGDDDTGSSGDDDTSGDDVDGDGFNSESSGGSDCDDDDAGVNPDAEEVWGDGVDQDCDGFDLCLPEDAEWPSCFSDVACSGWEFGNGECGESGVCARGVPNCPDGIELGMPERRGCTSCYDSQATTTFALTGSAPLDVGLLLSGLFLLGLRRRRGNGLD